jgi:hypothetical protein
LCHVAARALTDTTSRVRTSAAHALCVLATAAGEDGLPEAASRNALSAACNAVTHAVSAGERACCLDALCALVGASRSLLNGVDGLAVQQALLNALAAAWGVVCDDDADVVALLESVTALAPSLGASLASAAPALWTRAVRIAEMDLTMFAAAKMERTAPPLPDRLAASFDVLASLAESLGDVEGLFASSTPVLAHLLMAGASTADSSVRQSVFALVGELAKAAPRGLSVVAAALVHPAALTIQTASRRTIAAANNAAWAVGLLADTVMSGDVVAAAANTLAGPLASALSTGIPNEMLHANIATAAGRLARAAPHAFAAAPPGLSSWLRAWIAACVTIRDFEERSVAFEGLCAVLKIHPNAAATTALNLSALAQAFAASFEPGPPQKVGQMMGELLHGYKHSGAQSGAWAATWALCNQACKDKLTITFGALAP